MKIGFIGLGNVGGKLAGSLLRNDMDLTVFDLDPDLVADFAAKNAHAGVSAYQLMSDCDVVITCLPDLGPSRFAYWRDWHGEHAQGDDELPRHGEPADGLRGDGDDESGRA